MLHHLIVGDINAIDKVITRARIVAFYPYFLCLIDSLPSYRKRRNDERALVGETCELQLAKGFSQTRINE